MKRRSEAFHFWHNIMVSILMGVLALGLLFVYSVDIDLGTAEARFADAISTIKEQCSGYDNLNLGSETKSLIRVVENAQQLRRNIEKDTTYQPGFVLDDAAVENYLEERILTGILVLTPEGKVVCSASEDGLTDIPLTAETLPRNVARETLLDVADHPEKVYAGRVDMRDGSYVDMASCSRPDAPGVLVVYYHTPAEYVHTYSLSYQTAVQGYNIESDGIVAVTQGDRIVASNMEELIGTSVKDSRILSILKDRATDDEMIHVHTSGEHAYGMVERGRNFYVYIYRREQQVFGSTPRNMAFGLAAYLVVLFAVQMIRVKMDQRYRREQLRREQEYQKELKAEAVKAEAANVAKTEFLQRMSHDIRTPINGIRGMVEISGHYPDDKEKQAECRRKIWDASTLLLELVNEVLDMGKLESGEVVLEHTPFDLQEMICEIEAVLEKQASERGIKITCLPLDVRHTRLIGSPLHVKRLLMNILSNAIKYNKEKGSVTLSCHEYPEDENHARFSFICADTGIGMSEEFQKRMYEPFTQENGGARSTYGGTGLGMAITKSLVDKMGGTIECQSQQGVGTTYTITLPFELDHSAAAEAARAEEDAESISLEGMNVLLAEDNELNIEIAEFLLTEKGVHVTKAYDGRDAVEKFKASPVGGFDAILMDVMMPMMDGHEATREIRALDRPDAAAIPIFAMTANAFPEDRQKALEAGMTDHMTKPLEPAVLFRMLSRAAKSLQRGGNMIK